MLTTCLHWPYLVSYAWLSHPLILGFYIPLWVVLCPYLVFSTVRTTLPDQELHHLQLTMLCSQVKCCPVHLWKKAEKINTAQQGWESRRSHHLLQAPSSQHSYCPCGQMCHTSKIILFYSAVNLYSALLRVKLTTQAEQNYRPVFTILSHKILERTCL